jgi:peptidoglycan/xylan/chitin deacetylase (PgdA/CDA1 family)
MSDPNQPVPRIIVVFRNDDPSALSDLDHERRIFALFEEYGVPQTLGVIPKVSLSDLHDPRCGGEKSLLENPAMVEFLRDYVARSGSEVALHGFTHRTNRFSSPARRDYFELQQLPYEEQLQMIREGTAILEQAFGERPVTFVPPWNRLDHQTVAACRAAGYRIISGLSFTEVDGDLLSFGTNTDLADFPAALQQARQSRHQVFLSILMHSSTIRSEGEISRLRMALELASRDPEVTCTTISQVVARWPELVIKANDAGRNTIALYQVEGSARARISPYVNLIPGFRKISGLGPLLDGARRRYREGDYQGAGETGREIDLKSSWWLRAVRVLLFLAGGLLGGLALSILSHHRASPLTPLLWLLPVAVGAAGWLVARRVSAVETRGELGLAGGVCAAGLAFALALLPRL